MMAHLKYLRYVLLHRWFVFLECCKLGIPIRGMVHDLSKFRWSEWSPYTNYFYGRHTEKGLIKGGVPLEKATEAFDRAWLLHQKRNPHHWQSWILIKDNDKRQVALDMPMDCRKEMLADWRGAARSIRFADSAAQYYKKHRYDMFLHSQTRKWLEDQLGIVDEPVATRRRTPDAERIVLE
jgi:hypothetical protein